MLGMRHGSAAIVMALVAVAVSGVVARAADPPALQNVLIIDLRHIMVDSKAGKTIRGQMQTQYNTYQKQFQQTEQDLIAARQELQRQQSILAQDAFEAKAKEFEQRVADLNQKKQEAQNTLAQAEGQANQTERVAIQEILRGIAAERGANLVLEAGTVMLFDPHNDVSEEVLKRLDQKLPSVTVSFV